MIFHIVANWLGLKVKAFVFNSSNFFNSFNFQI